MFVKEPIAGFVKTRLSKTLGEQPTLELYKHFVNDLISTLKGTKYEFKLCVYPCVELINKTFGNYNNFLQDDGDLGVKMKNAFQSQFNLGYEKIILIGSDTPHIPQSYFDKTFQELNTKELVLGPSLDGGYYLIAFNKNTFNPFIFEKITWSSELVLKQTLQKVNKSTIYLLEQLNDIDTQEDLEDFYKQFKSSYFSTSNSITYLKDIQWKNLM